jgi:hypothetical protein
VVGAAPRAIDPNPAANIPAATIIRVMYRIALHILSLPARPHVMQNRKPQAVHL